MNVNEPVHNWGVHDNPEDIDIFQLAKKKAAGNRRDPSSYPLIRGYGHPVISAPSRDSHSYGASCPRIRSLWFSWTYRFHSQVRVIYRWTFDAFYELLASPYSFVLGVNKLALLHT